MFKCLSLIRTFVFYRNTTLKCSTSRFSFFVKVSEFRKFCRTRMIRLVTCCTGAHIGIRAVGVALTGQRNKTSEQIWMTTSSVQYCTSQKPTCICGRHFSLNTWFTDRWYFRVKRSIVTSLSFFPWLLLSVQKILCLGRTTQMWTCHEVFDFAPCLLKSMWIYPHE